MSKRRQISSAAAALLFIVAMPSACAARGSASQPDSGVRGRVLYGPTCPVQRIGQNCFRPAQGTIRITSEQTGRLIARVRTSSNGHFTVFLPPGRYVLVLLTPYTANPGARTRQTIAVHRHRFTDAILNSDSATR